MKRRFFSILLFAVPLLLGSFCAEASSPAVQVGSKKFTESVILGDIATLHLRNQGIPAEHRKELGGTRVLFNALLNGDIDLYPEYTGTIRLELLRDESVPDRSAMHAALARRGIIMTDPLGFNNTYAIGMRPGQADELGIRTISDLADHPELVFGLTNEFLNRGDGWPSLARAYGLDPETVIGMDHDLAYRALQSGDIDVMDLYSTDAEIAYYGLRVLEDDRSHFETYEAVYLFRGDLAERHPDAVEAIGLLSGRLDEARIQGLNRAVKLDGRADASVAADFLDEEFGTTTEVQTQSLLQRLAARSAEHLALVGLAMLFGILVALPLGIWASRNASAGAVILGAVGIIQTIPSLALLVFMIPLLGIAGPPAVAALFLYSLLPMVRMTHAGLTGISPALLESAQALGLSPRDRLLHVELPLASPSILAGVKTSTVITIGFATLGALIGAGGYGQPILTGIRLDDYGLILEGALPAAGLALLAQAFFALIERWIVPLGLRLPTTSSD